MCIKSKKWMSFFILGTILVCLFTGLAHAQTTTGQENWVYIWYEGYDYDAQFRDIRRSPYDGYIYATGRKYRNAGNFGVSLVKIDPATGFHVWSQILDPPGTDYNGDGYEIDFDNAGNIYIAAAVQQGFHRRDFTIIKCNTSGTVLHWNFYGYSQNDYAFTVDIGPDNMVYVGGYIIDGRVDYIVRKYDTACVYQNRMYRLYADGHNMECRRVRVDNNLNVWSCGKARIDSGNADFFVALCDTSLSEINHYKINGTSSGVAYAYDLSLSWSGTGVYACGYVDNSGTGNDFTVVRLDNNCNEVWRYEYPNSGEDRALALVAAPSDRVFVAGYTNNTARAGEEYTVMSMRFGVDWMWVYDGTAGGSDQAVAIDIDSAGTTVFATGHGSKIGADTTDIICSKHTLNDTTIWVYQYNGPGAKQDEAWSIDVSNDGNLYIAGFIKKRPIYNYDPGAISLPQNFPPTVPIQISPADSAFLSDTVGVSWMWNASTDIETSTDKYILYYDTTRGFATPESLTSADTTASTTLNDAKYYWKVKAQDTQGQQSRFTDVWTLNFDLTQPNIPALMFPINGSFVTSLDVDFEWGSVIAKDVPTLIHYVLQVDMDNQFPAPIVDDTLTLTTTTKTMPDEATYYWRIKAFDLAGNQSNWSGANNYMVDVTAPLIDSTTQLENTALGSLGPFNVYTWVYDLFGIDSVVLWFQRQEDPGWITVDMRDLVPGNWWLEQIYAVSQLDDTVKYKIYAKDSAGYSTWDPPVDYYWFIAQDQGVEEFDNPTVFSFGLKSNPAKGMALFNLALPEDALINLRIYDVSGRLIDKPVSGTMTAGTYEIPWNSKVSSGIFFYRLDSPWQQKVGKLVLLK